jgi:hypothetical protein
MIELWSSHTKTGLNISKALPKGELSKRHAKELVRTGELLDFVVAVVSLDAFTELV